MKNIGFLVIGCASLFIIPSCMTDALGEDSDQVDVAEADLAAAPDVVANAVVGTHRLRLVNTLLCLQPQGGSAGDVLVELHACDTSAAQRWIFSNQSNGTALINQNSSKCLYNNAGLFNGGRPIDHESCFVSGTGNIASNALWKVRTAAAGISFESRVTFRDTGFCMDVPGGFPFDGVTFQMWGCNGTGAQLYIVE